MSDRIKIDEALEELGKGTPRFERLLQITWSFFGKPRISGSHHIFKMPWADKPWINLQMDGKMAKNYQVKQVIKALEKLKTYERN